MLMAGDTLVLWGRRCQPVDKVWLRSCLYRDLLWCVRAVESEIEEFAVAGQLDRIVGVSLDCRQEGKEAQLGDIG